LIKSQDSTGNEEETILIDSRASLAQAYFEIFFNRIFPEKFVAQRLQDHKTHLGFLFEHFVHTAMILSTAESKDRFFGTKLDTFCCRLLANLQISGGKIPPFKQANDCKLKSFCESLGMDCPKMPLLGPMNEDYSFLKESVNADFQIGKLLLPDNSKKVDGAIENSSPWNFILECKYWADSLANADIAEIVENAFTYKMPGEKRIFFIVARTANLQVENLSLAQRTACYFQLAGPSTTTRTPNVVTSVEFKSSLQKNQVPQAFNTLVIILSLETLFGSYDLLKSVVLNIPNVTEAELLKEIERKDVSKPPALAQPEAETMSPIPAEPVATDIPRASLQAGPEALPAAPSHPKAEAIPFVPDEPEAEPQAKRIQTRPSRSPLRPE
jgi:hypothetical protein